MHKATPTKTTGPLHFEDLEPHRFEDLVRRLIYDFRPWRELQATGRTGSDDGFDARGFERGPDDAIDLDELSADEDGPRGNAGKDKVWLIQCKRERKITPKKLLDYLDEIPADELRALYGIVFVAACDFSKASHDAFRERVQQLGISEGYLWGKGELEDLLYQPKNDDVLFTFFGVSRRFRQRSIATGVRSRLAVKRKARRVLERSGVEVLLRDSTDDRYPHADEEDGIGGRRWHVYRFEGCHHDGMHFLAKRCLAFVGDDDATWDYAEGMNDASAHENPWRTKQDEVRLREFAAERERAMTVWDALPPANRAWLERFYVLRYEHVIDIDELGDERFRGPHVYVVEFDGKRGPFRDYELVKLETIDQWGPKRGRMDPAARVEKFARVKKTDPSDDG